MTAAPLLLQFALCAALIGGAGYLLTLSADRIAKATGLTGGWLGLALLATVTSLPELSAGIAAVTLVDAPDLAVGNALGACVFNLAFLAIVDAVQRREPLYLRASGGHLLSAAFGIVLLGVVALALLVGEHAPVLLHVGVYSPLLLGLYLVAMHSVHVQETRGRAAADGAASPRDRAAFTAAAIVVVLAGSWLPSIAESVALHMGWSRSFVGTLFMAMATTLPEAAVTASALRLGALDMAVGNLLGSNMFNVAILAVADSAYVRGPLLAAATPAHAGTAIAAIVMTALVMIGLLLRPQRRILRAVTWVSVGLLALSTLNAALHLLRGE